MMPAKRELQRRLFGDLNLMTYTFRAMLVFYLLSSRFLLGLTLPSEVTRRPKAVNEILPSLQTSRDLTLEKQETGNQCGEPEETISAGDKQLNSQDNTEDKGFFDIQGFNSFAKLSKRAVNKRATIGYLKNEKKTSFGAAQRGIVLEQEEKTNRKAGNQEEQRLESLRAALLTDLIVIPPQIREFVQDIKKVTKNPCAFPNEPEATVIPPSTGEPTLIPQNISEAASVAQTVIDVTLGSPSTKQPNISPEKTEQLNIETDNRSGSIKNPDNTSSFNKNPDNTSSFNKYPDNTSSFNKYPDNTSSLNKNPDKEADLKTVLLKQPESSHDSKVNAKTPALRIPYADEVFNLAGLYIPYCQARQFCLSRCDLSFRSDEPSSQIDDLTLHPKGSKQTQNLGALNRPQDVLCNCDRKCVIYADCCADVFQNCWNVTSTEGVESSIIQTRLDNVIDTSHGSLVNQLRKLSENAEQILDYMYVQFASCELKNLHENIRKLFITHCPAVVGPALRQECENNTAFVLPPVTAVVGRFHLIFVNKFCARCHGVLEEEFTSWSAWLMCNNGQQKPGYQQQVYMADIAIVERFKLCNVSYADQMEVSQQRLCFTSEKRTASYKQSLLESVASGACKQTDMLLCESYYFYMDLYRNPHCQACLGAGRRAATSVSDTATEQSHYSVTCKDVQEVANGGGYVDGIFVLLAVNEPPRGREMQDGHITVQPSPICDETQVFDRNIKACSALACPKVALPHHAGCSSTVNIAPSQQGTARYQDDWIELNLFLQTPELDFWCEHFKRAFMEALPNVIIKSSLLNDDQATATLLDGQSLSWCADLYSSNSTGSLTSFNLSLNITMDLDVSSWKRLTAFSQNLSLNNYQLTINSLSFPNSSICGAGDFETSFDLFTIEEVFGVVLFVITSTRRTLYYPLRSVGYRLKVENGNNVSRVSELVVVCEVSKLFFRPDCDVVDYALEETALSKAQLISRYGDDNVDIHENKVYICIQSKSAANYDLEFTGNNEKINSDITFIILSWTLTSLSVMCLLVMLTVYCLFPELCTLPGKMTASLAATMLLTLLLNTLGLVKLHHQYICPVVAVVSHAVSLAQFGWMSAIAVNMALTFGPYSVRVKSVQSNKSWIRYNIVVWGLTFLIVATSVALDLIHTDKSSDQDSPQCNNSTSGNQSSEGKFECSVPARRNEFPQYGGLICTWFIAPVWAKVAFVVAPFSLSYVVNVVCFVITLVGIHLSSRRTKKLCKKSSNRVQCIIFVKISTAMGFSWVLGLPWKFHRDNNVIAYICASIILLQGVLLFLAFMANKRVIRIVKRFIGGPEMSTRTLSAGSAGSAGK